jgi:hypothetical protein
MVQSNYIILKRRAPVACIAAKMSNAEDKVTRLLPKSYTYKFSSVSYETELQFSASLRVQEIRSEKDFKKWQEEYTRNTKSGWITARANFKKSSKFAHFAYAKDFSYLLSSALTKLMIVV